MIYIRKKKTIHTFFPCFTFFRAIIFVVGVLHSVNERKTPSLSAEASFAPFSLKVAWSGKSLIGKGGSGCMGEDGKRRDAGLVMGWGSLGLLG